MIIGNRIFKDHTYIMGILNLTPDSFSDGGKFNSTDTALKHVEKMILEGADIIDVGGESTRPGYKKISDSEETERVCSIIEKIKSCFDIPVSIDTYKHTVAENAIKSGADLINDIYGFRYNNGKMAQTAVKYNKPACLMHNRDNTDYKDFLSDVTEDLRESIRIAKNAGLSDDMIILDPGIGFAKSLQQNLLLTNNLEALHTLGFPLLYGASRKSMIGLSLDLPVSERLEGTLATTVLAVLKNCLFVRVHDIKENKRVIMMTEKITGRM